MLLWSSGPFGGALESAAARLLANAEAEARRIAAAAETEGQRISKDAEILARERLLAARTEFERETRDVRMELIDLESRLGDQETEINSRIESLTEREQVESRLWKRRSMSARVGSAPMKKSSKAAVSEQRVRLEQIAGLTIDQAKAELLRSMENEARMDAANLVKRIEDETNEKAKEKARRVISMAIQRIASEHVVESTVSVVDLPSDEMKGRIIGREGRNIRAFEQATGVDLIVDDTPEAVILSCFEPVRREIARLALTKPDPGRAHPPRGGSRSWSPRSRERWRRSCWPTVRRPRSRSGFRISTPSSTSASGTAAVPLLIRPECPQALDGGIAWLSNHMAAELGADAAVAKRAGLVHDIGKAVDREMDGTHLELGRELLRKHGETDAVIHAMECHHGDYDPHSVEAVLVTAADALSAARPGARREILQNYIKRLEKLESMATDFKGRRKGVRDPGRPRAANRRRVGTDIGRGCDLARP